MKKKNLITAALPYINNIPHLGNLVQVLSADAFARYSRLQGHETLYICGTDEYGTATETKALIEKTSPEELCNKFYKIHKEIYEWFNIKFDIFGRTTNEQHKEIVQKLFLAIQKNGFTREQISEQFFCESCNKFLADRYIVGQCPNCQGEAQGDQCENCGKLLDPVDLIKPKCSICLKQPIIKKTKHLYIDLPKIKDQLSQWIQETTRNGNWNNNAINMTEAWLKSGLKMRAITRDLKWGIPVPKEGYENKVFYIWFDAPIGYISITKELTNDWTQWWNNPQETNLIQFIGKDNIPFHTVLFPAIQLASQEKWTMLTQLSSSEYLNYENLKFSKSAGIGIFGTDARDTGIPSDVWRFYIYYNRPEKADTQFLWNDFMERVNNELIGNFSNLINRVLTFYKKSFGNKIGKMELKYEFWRSIKESYVNIENLFKNIELKTVLKEILKIAAFGNKIFQDSEPWKSITKEQEKTKQLLVNLIYLIRDLSILISPFIPQTSMTIRKFLGNSYELSYAYLATNKGIDTIDEIQILFTKLEKETIEKLKLKYLGDNMQTETCKLFSKTICLKTAKILKVERHPNAQKLYILKLDDGSQENRQIVSSLVDFYSIEELLNKHIILVDNLKPIKLRGVMSKGMLLGVDTKESHEKLISKQDKQLTATEEQNREYDFEIIFLENSKDHPIPGERVVLETDCSEKPDYPTMINIDQFDKIKILSQNGKICIDSINLVFEQSRSPIIVKKILNGMVN